MTNMSSYRHSSHRLLGIITLLLRCFNGQEGKRLFAECDQAYNASESAVSFKTENYPRWYHDDTDCTIRIYAKRGYVIRIITTEIDLQEDYYGSCIYDYLLIRDGDSIDSPTITNLCGKLDILNITSTGPDLWLMFHSDSYTTGRGFYADFEAVLPGERLFAECGQAYNASESAVSFKTENYPGMYPHNTDCTIRIYAKRGYVIRLITTEIDLEIEEYGPCYYDYLLIRDGDSMDSPTIAILCGNLDNINITSTGPDLWIMFHSDQYVTGTGFYADFEAVLPGERLFAECDQAYNASESAVSFKNENYPGLYNHDTSCTIRIYAQRGYVIRMNITEIDLQEEYYAEYNRPCNTDYLLIRDGDSMDSPTIATLCGKLDNLNIISTGPDLWIMFYSDESNTGTGFYADFEAVLPVKSNSSENDHRTNNTQLS